jgi:hypothetical protein
MKTHTLSAAEYLREVCFAHPVSDFFTADQAAEAERARKGKKNFRRLVGRTNMAQGALFGGSIGAGVGSGLSRAPGLRAWGKNTLAGAGAGILAGAGIGAFVRHRGNDLSSLVEGMVALEGRADAILFGVDLKREPMKAPDCGATPCDVEKPSYPTVFLRLEGEKAASLAHVKNGDEVVLKGKVVSVEVRDRQGDTPTSSRSVDIECHELLPDAPTEEKLGGGEASPAKAGGKKDEKKPVALDACPRVVSLSNSDRLAEVVELSLFGPQEDRDRRPSLLRRTAGVLGTAALVGGAAYGANRIVQGRYGKGASSWGAAADEAKLRFRSAWGAPRAAITPPVVGAPTSDYVAPGAIVPSNVKPSVGGVASTRKMAGNFKQVPVGTLAADARRVGRYTLQNVARGPLLPKQRFSAADYLRVVFLDRARNADGQFDPGQAPMSPDAMAAAYPARERPGVAGMIAASHRRRQKRDLMAGGIGLAAGAAAGAGAVPAWQYLRSVMGR